MESHMLTADAQLLQSWASPGVNLDLKLNSHETQTIASSFLERTATLETADTWIKCRSRATAAYHVNAVVAQQVAL